MPGPPRRVKAARHSTAAEAAQRQSLRVCGHKLQTTVTDVAASRECCFGGGGYQTNRQLAATHCDCTQDCLRRRQKGCKQKKEKSPNNTMRLPSVCGPDVAEECFGSCEVPYLWMAWCSAIAYQKSTQEHRGSKKRSRRARDRTQKARHEARSTKQQESSRNHEAEDRQQQTRSKGARNQKQDASTQDARRSSKKREQEERRKKEEENKQRKC